MKKTLTDFPLILGGPFFRLLCRLRLCDDATCYCQLADRLAAIVDALISATAVGGGSQNQWLAATDFGSASLRCGKR